MSDHPFFRLEHPIAMAHRGSRLLWPENTMVAFQQAVDLGYRYIETDLHATRDRALVCLHDPTLDRTTNAAGNVSGRDLADLVQIDAGHWTLPDEGYPYRAKGARIPSLEEAMTTFPKVHFTLELKQDDTEGELVELLNRLHGWDRVLVGSFNDRRLERLRELAVRQVATSAGTGETLRFWAGARLGRTPRLVADALQVPVRHRGLTVVDQKLVAAAHRADKQVHVWTVNQADQMVELLDLGVDGIISDRPDILRAVLGRAR